MKKNIFLLPIIVMVFSCKTGTKDPLLPRVSGAAGEVIVVMDNMNWEGVVGETLKNCLAKPYPALPQLEPAFDLIHVTQANLTDLFKLNRNIIFCNIKANKDSAFISYKQDVWAQPQLVAQIDAPNAEAFQKFMNEQGGRLYDVLEDAERKRITKSFKVNQDEKIFQTLKKRNISLTIPHNFKLDVSEEDFMWLTNETPDYMQGIVIYEYPREKSESISKEELIQTQDEFSKKYIKGPVEGSYMQTEKRLDINFEEFILRKQLYIASIRGLWKLENAFMGGPFINVTTIDSTRNRAITVYGYVYAPNTKKRNLTRQLDAILLSLELLEKQE